MNENQNNMYQNMWDTAKAVLWGKFIAFNTYNKNRKVLYQSNLHFKKLEKGKQNKSKAKRRNKEWKWMKLKTKTLEKIKKQRAGFFKRSLKLANL